MGQPFVPLAVVTCYHNAAMVSFAYQHTGSQWAGVTMACTQWHGPTPGSEPKLRDVTSPHTNPALELLGGRHCRRWAANAGRPGGCVYACHAAGTMAWGAPAATRPRPPLDGY